LFANHFNRPTIEPPTKILALLIYVAAHILLYATPESLIQRRLMQYTRRTPHNHVSRLIESRISELRDLVKHENELTNNRLTWMLASQTLLIGAYAAIYSQIIGKKLSWSMFTAVLILFFMSLLGYSTSRNTKKSVKKSDEALKHLRDHTNYLIENGDELPISSKFLHPLAFADMAFPSDEPQMLPYKPTSIAPPPWLKLPKFFSFTWIVLAALALLTLLPFPQNCQSAESGNQSITDIRCP
jgi:hypothetical protein